MAGPSELEVLHRHLADAAFMLAGMINSRDKVPEMGELVRLISDAQAELMRITRRLKDERHGGPPASR